MEQIVIPVVGMEPLISVIVPVYKVEKSVPNCIDSILAQTYRNLEIILVDDGSPDRCGQICDEYAKKDTRICVIHKENGGLSSARNAGIDICRGEYISFIDSDDFVSPYFIEILYKGIRGYNADISGVDSGVDFYDKTEQDVRLVSDVNECKVSSIEPYEAIRRILYQSLPNGAQWRLYKREIFRELRFPFGYLFEDAATTHRAFMLAKKVALISARIYAYRVRSDSIVRMKFSDKKLISTVIGEQIVEDIMQYDADLYVAACSRAFALNYQVFIQIPPEDTASLRKVWEQLLRYRDVVIHDKTPELRTKNRVGAWCTYLGMRFAHEFGRMYKYMSNRRMMKRMLHGTSGTNFMKASRNKRVSNT